MSPVELLREAARLMRERANAATTAPWEPHSDQVWSPEFPAGLAWRETGITVCADAYTNADATHIASWHPAVALAVADWLLEASVEGGISESRCALAVARAYLGGGES